MVVNADYRHSLCRRYPEKTSRGEMDGSNDRLPVSGICREAGHEPPVVTQGRMPLFLYSAQRKMAGGEGSVAREFVRVLHEKCH